MMLKALAELSSTLYEQDYVLWLEKMVLLLGQGRLSELDIPHLLEEIEDRGRSEKRAVENNLVIILMHLLNYQFQPAMRSNSWRSTIREHRRRLRKALNDSPSLVSYLNEVFGECYQDARAIASDETGLSFDEFPAQPVFTSEQTLSPDFLPE